MTRALLWWAHSGTADMAAGTGKGKGQHLWQACDSLSAAINSAWRTFKKTIVSVAGHLKEH